MSSASKWENIGIVNTPTFVEQPQLLTLRLPDAIMASLKRKEGPGGASTTKSSKTSSGPRPSKRTKSEKPDKEERKSNSKENKAPAAKTAAAPVISRLKEEEPLFPRGGGSILSPLEQKQIQLQAKKDVLFEQESSAADKKEEKASRAKKSRKSTEKKKGEAQDKPAFDEDAVKIESLNYKVCSWPQPKRPVLMLTQCHSDW